MNRSDQPDQEQETRTHEQGGGVLLRETTTALGWTWVALGVTVIAGTLTAYGATRPAMVAGVLALVLIGVATVKTVGAGVSRSRLDR